MKALRWIIVIVGTLLLSTLAINAFDNVDNPANSLLGAAFMAYSGSGGPCAKGMTLVQTGGTPVCIDVYEASAGGECPTDNPGSKSETDANLAVQECVPISAPEKMPWRNISRQQAELACARVGKRLPTNNEWYRAALGTPDAQEGWSKDDCNVDTSGPVQTGSRTHCVSPAGAHDMIGNAWEWMQETVNEGVYNGKVLPPEGYVTSIDSDGVPLQTSVEGPDAALFSDYFWVQNTDTRGIFRGGYWKSGSDAGQYTVNISVPPSFVGNAVGFRCAKDSTS